MPALRVVNTGHTGNTDHIGHTGKAAPKDKSLYFGYGSNLWKAQMLKRCPDSTYLGIARLDGYRWIINDRGYANVVQTSPGGERKGKGRDGDGGGEGDVVWGLVYRLTESDEENLDINEGVPYAYTKENLVVQFCPASGGEGEKPDVHGTSERREMLVYIDRERIEADEPKREYVYRMNMGIADAVKEGMPGSYVEQVMRRFIPEGKEEADGEVRRLAKKQAEAFEDEG